ncbi:protein of unknown function [Chryseobacterium sp. JV274]|nr:protein of unknown function [Chryseobacterium sp. JV274]
MLITVLELVQLPKLVEVITSLAPEGFTVKKEFPATGTLKDDAFFKVEIFFCAAAVSSVIIGVSAQD